MLSDALVQVRLALSACAPGFLWALVIMFLLLRVYHLLAGFPGSLYDSFLNLNSLLARLVWLRQPTIYGGGMNE